MRSGVIRSPIGHCIPTIYCLRSSSVRFRFGWVTLASATSDMPSGVVMMMSGWSAIEPASPYSTSFSEADHFPSQSLPFVGDLSHGRQPALRQHGHEPLIDDDPIAFVDPLFEKVKRRLFAAASLHLDPSESSDLLPAGCLRCQLTRVPSCVS